MKKTAIFGSAGSYYSFRQGVTLARQERIVAPELIERLWLYGKDGAKYWAHIFEERINASALSPGSWISGERTCLLEGGTPLKRIDESTFKNPLTGELLSRTPPKLAE